MLFNICWFLISLDYADIIVFVNEKGKDIGSCGVALNTSCRSVSYVCSKVDFVPVVINVGIGKFEESNCTIGSKNIMVIGDFKNKSQIHLVIPSSYLFGVDDGVLKVSNFIVSHRSDIEGNSFLILGSGSVFLENVYIIKDCLLECSRASVVVLSSINSIFIMNNTEISGFYFLKGHVISGESCSQIVVINCSFRNINTSENGNAILLFTNCTSKNGGAIYINTNRVISFTAEKWYNQTIQNCVFVDCSAGIGGMGGGFFYMIDTTSNWLLNNLTFQNCEAAHGSAFFIVGFSFLATINSYHISNIVVTKSDVLFICGVELNENQDIISLVPTIWCFLEFNHSGICPKECALVSVDSNISYPQSSSSLVPHHSLSSTNSSSTEFSSLTPLSPFHHSLSSTNSSSTEFSSLTPLSPFLSPSVPRDSSSHGSDPNQQIFCAVGSCWRDTDDANKPCPTGCLLEESVCVESCSKDYISINSARCIQAKCDVPATGLHLLISNEDVENISDAQGNAKTQCTEVYFDRFFFLCNPNIFLCFFFFFFFFFLIGVLL
jgi:hypothetical protein